MTNIKDEEPNYIIGDEVEDILFGRGKIVKIDYTTKYPITVSFNGIAEVRFTKEGTYLNPEFPLKLKLINRDIK